ncbi:MULTISPECIES: class I SAM-dependent methyltransferase [unclassified Ruegeria]|uniref:class I SAM-dependent methyltransferase n=1 Tax=unclassified Ruegeria TaxID=2625375 RepID=UPI0014918DBA|nr:MULTISPECIES: class I SAM-dependent methyltransferase [unclassified Ruegeria]NOC44813.1 class I SAM-dependent methyltransferase [Ruegeria sp. HKCCD7559]
MKPRKFPKINAALEELGVKLVDRVTEQDERARLEAFEAAGGLTRPAYALSPGMEGFDISQLVAEYERHKAALEALKDPARNQTGYRTGNGYYDSPDADALYLMIRRFQPKRVIEVGCGNSTRVTRQAIIDGNLDTTITAIDPYPRADIAHVVDRFEQKRLEETDPALFAELETGDILFIDSSHVVRMSNDVAHLFCRIIPSLNPGVVIHVHDVFLPYEYPKRFFYDCPGWGEQYVLHSLLQSGAYSMLWPGYYLQQDRPDAVVALPFLAEGRAQSIWVQLKEN